MVSVERYLNSCNRCQQSSGQLSCCVYGVSNYSFGTYGSYPDCRFVWFSLEVSDRVPGTVP